MITTFEKYNEIIKTFNLYKKDSYIILSANRWSKYHQKYSPVIFLLEIISKRTIQEYDDKNNIIYFYYIDVKILDYISKDKQDIELNSITHISIEDNQKFDILYSSFSNKESVKKFNELKNQSPYKEWIVKSESEKYNL